MYPDLFSIGFLHVKTYGCCMALGFFAAWQVLVYLCRRIGRPFEPLGNLVVSLMIAGVLGSRVAYVIEHWKAEFADRLVDIIRIDQGGLMFYGGFILAVAVFVFWCIWKKDSPLALGDLLCVVIPLGHAFGRIGCFFYGCCYGKLSSSCVEAAANLALFAALFFFFRRFRRGTMALYLIGYAIIRFGMEYLRGDPRAAVGPFSISQTISLALLFAGLTLLAVMLCGKRQAPVT